MQVIHGAANVWDPGTNLYYAIRWRGVCPSGSARGSSGPPPDEECTGAWSTAIDAHSGELIVSGM